MDLKRKFLICLTCLFLVTLVLGFKYENQSFPLDKEGYPLADTIVINSKKYKIHDDLHIKMTGENTLILPQILSIGLWVLREDQGVELLEELTYLPDDERYYELKGPSPFLQKFTFRLEGDGDLIFNYYSLEDLINSSYDCPIHSLRIRNKGDYSKDKS